MKTLGPVLKTKLGIGTVKAYIRRFGFVELSPVYCAVKEVILSFNSARMG
jgi:hypothetical protein